LTPVAAPAVVRYVASLAALASLAQASLTQAPPACVELVDVTAEAGLDFRHRSGRSPRRHLPETMGAGVAWLDADGDGWLDAYLVQSGRFPPAGGDDATDALLRNQGDGTFMPVRAGAGAGERAYGQGVVAADVDGDGDTDLLLANYGPNTLLLNRGDGRFVDATAAAGLEGGGWSSAAAFGDADGDGDLDLYVVRYVDYDPDHQLFCGDFDAGERDYCDPTAFAGVADLFYRNRGGGAFAEESAVAGLAGPAYRGLGVVFVDLDGDRRPEIYVTNDMDPNLLFRNLGDRFEDVSLLSGAAVSREGAPQAGMGIAIGDLEGDGAPELAATNFDDETNTLYRNLGGLQFDDVSAASGFGPPSYNLLGFGIVLADLDLDGDLDAFVANGHVVERPTRDSTTYAQPPLLLAGDGRGRFQRCELPAARPRVGRGLAAADYDSDGDVDLLASANDDSPRLWRNEMSAPWLGVWLKGAPPNTGGVGAALSLGTQRRWILAGESYQSSSDPRVLFAAGPQAPADLRVTWPGGQRQRFVRPPLGRYLVVPQPRAPSP
jgi:hypothetical protein